MVEWSLGIRGGGIVRSGEELVRREVWPTRWGCRLSLVVITEGWRWLGVVWGVLRVVID